MTPITQESLQRKASSKNQIPHRNKTTIGAADITESCILLQLHRISNINKAI